MKKPTAIFQLLYPFHSNAATSPRVQRLLMQIGLAVIVSLMVGLVISPAKAQADRISEGDRPWVDSLRSLMRADRLTYVDTDVTEPRYRERLQQIAWDQAQIWGDTILEGDYWADEEVLLDLVQAVFRDGIQVAWRITYSSKAFDTSVCTPYEYADEDPARFTGCIPGRIHESSFVSMDLKSFIRDDEAFAEFIEN